jgi:hypothetical protein
MKNRNVPAYLEHDDWLLSRTWLARSAAAIIVGFLLLIAGAAYRPLLPIAVIAILVALYAIGRFCWHLQRSANARRRKGRKVFSNPFVRALVYWPVPIGLAFALVWVVVGVLLVKGIKP